MAKNYYDPRNIRRMTRNTNMRNQDFLRWQKQQADRRAEEQERLRAAEQAAADLANGSVLNELKIVISAQAVSASEALDAVSKTFAEVGRLFQEGLRASMSDALLYNQQVNRMSTTIQPDTPVYLGKTYQFGTDFASDTQAPKPPRIEPSPFSMIEVDDES